MSKFQILTRANDSTNPRDWTACVLGEPGANLFDTREEAEAAIEELRALGGAWQNASYHVVVHGR